MSFSLSSRPVLAAFAGVSLAIGLAALAASNGGPVEAGTRAINTIAISASTDTGFLRGGIADLAILPDDDPPIRLADESGFQEGWFVSRPASDGSVAENVGTYGSLSSLPYFRFVIQRAPGPADDLVFPEIARRAAETGAGVTRLSGIETVSTRFGDVSVATAQLDDAEGRRAGCHVFRFIQGDLEINGSGWLCDSDEPTRSQRLVCLIESLSLSAHADYLPLRVAFREARAREPACRRTLSDPGRAARATEAATPADAATSTTAKPAPRPIKGRPRQHA